MKKSFTKRLVSTGNSVAFLPLRLALGIIFLAHGSQKLFGLFGGGGIKGTAGFLSGLGLEPGTVFAIAAGTGEFLGGLLLFLGLFTRIGALLIIAVMAVAISKVHFNAFFTSDGGMEFPLTLLTAAIGFLIVGAGQLSFDRLFAGKPSKSASDKTEMRK